MTRFNACVSITPATPIFLEKQHFNLIRVENNINYREVMMSLIYFDSYVKYDYERFLAKALKDTKPTPNQEAKIKEIMVKDNVTFESVIAPTPPFKKCKRKIFID